MNHYDGPAFFRKYNRPKKPTISPDRPQLTVPGKKLETKQEPPAIVTRETIEPVKAAHREVPVSDKKPIKKDWHAALPFRPSTLPKPLNYGQPKRDMVDYFRLVSKYFNKSDDDVMVLDHGDADHAQIDRGRFTFESQAAAQAAQEQAVSMADSASDMHLANSVTKATDVDHSSAFTATSRAGEQADAHAHSTESSEDVTAADGKTDAKSQREARIAAIQRRIDTLNDQHTSSAAVRPTVSESSSDATAQSLSGVTSAKHPVSLNDETVETVDGPNLQHTKPISDAINEDHTASNLEVGGTVSHSHFEHEAADQKPAENVAAAPKPDEVEGTTEGHKEIEATTREHDEIEATTRKHDEIEVAPQKPEMKPAAQSERGLGHSLGDILSEENTSSQLNDLALFHDKPNVENDTSQTGRGYHFPSASLLTPPVLMDDEDQDEWIQHQGEVLDETLKAFHVDAHVVDWTVGPTVTQFQVHLALGVKVNKITNLTDDLKLALAAKDIRIEAPIPGKTTVGIEIPNPKTRPVMLSEVLESQAFQNSHSPLTVALGVDLFGQPKVTDLRKMPHGLIAGATGSGKSVFINSLLISLLYKATPAELRLLLIDPKAVELAPYDGLPHLLSPVISDPKAAAAALKWAVNEMDDRYERLAAAGVRNIEQYNERAELTEDYGLKLPYIVIVIDELADLMMMASSEVQDYIVRITQKARAAGIHLLIATQRPSVDIVTGVIKNNIPTRIAFMVSSQVDSRTILDTSGAERLLGKGDMLFLGNGASQPLRLQGTFVDDEVDRITDFVRTQGKPHFAFDPDGLLEKQQVQDNQDELLPEVLDYIVQEKTVSTSKLQRVFSIGYNRSANLIDTLENKQYISGQNGSKPRDVFLTEKQLAEMRAPRTD